MSSEMSYPDSVRWTVQSADEIASYAAATGDTASEMSGGLVSVKAALDEQGTTMAHLMGKADELVDQASETSMRASEPFGRMLEIGLDDSANPLGQELFNIADKLGSAGRAQFESPTMRMRAEAVSSAIQRAAELIMEASAAIDEVHGAIRHLDAITGAVEANASALPEKAEEYIRSTGLEG